MDKFYVITNSEKDQDQSFTDMIVSYLKSHGKACQVQMAKRKQDGPYHILIRRRSLRIPNV